MKDSSSGVVSSESPSPFLSPTEEEEESKYRLIIDIDRGVIMDCKSPIVIRMIESCVKLVAKAVHTKEMLNSAVERTKYRK